MGKKIMGVPKSQRRDWQRGNHKSWNRSDGHRKQFVKNYKQKKREIRAKFRGATRARKNA